MHGYVSVSVCTHVCVGGGGGVLGCTYMSLPERQNSREGERSSAVRSRYLTSMCKSTTDIYLSLMLIHLLTYKGGSFLSIEQYTPNP
jgi:hypothetical protein